MIKFASKTAEGEFIGLILDAENIRRLQAGDPIAFEMTITDDQGRHEPLTLRVLIAYGESQERMMQDLHEFIGPDTHVEGLP
jgi:hypothetical protein